MKGLLGNFLPPSIRSRTVSKSSKYDERKSKILSKRFAKFYSQLQSERKNSLEQNKALRSTLDQIDKNINEEISEIRETSNKELENLRLDLARVVGENCRLQCEKEALSKTTEKLNNRICKVQNFANSISLEIKQYLGENGRLSSELEFEKKCSAEFYKDVESKREEIKELEINNYELGEEIRSLKSKIAIAESEKVSNCKTDCSNNKIDAFTFNLDNLFEKIRDVLNVDPADSQELFRIYNVDSSDSDHKINGTGGEDEERIDDGTKDPIVMPVVEVKGNSSREKSRADNCSNFVKLKAVFEEMQLELDSALLRNKTLEKNLEILTNRYSEEYDQRCDNISRLRKEVANLRDNLKEKDAQLEMLHSLNQNLDKNLFRAEIAITDCKKFNDSSTLIVQNPASSLSIVDNEESIQESSARYIRVLEKSCRGPLVLLKCNEDSVTLCNLFEESSIDLEGLSLEVFQIDFCDKENRRDQKYSLISHMKFGDSDQIEAGCIMDVKIQIFATSISEDASDQKELSYKKNSPKLLPKRSKIQLVDSNGEIASFLVVEISDTNFHSKKLNILTKGLNTIWKKIRRIN